MNSAITPLERLASASKAAIYKTADERDTSPLASNDSPLVWSDRMPRSGHVVTGETKVLEAAPSTPAVSYAERVTDALREIRHRLEAMFVGRVTATRTKRGSSEAGGESAGDLILFSADIIGASPEELGNATSVLLDYLATHPDVDVLNDVTVSLCEANA
jgi:hypothetical protein